MYSLSATKKNFTILIVSDGNGNPTYIGKARVGIPTSAAKWQIQKMEYNGTVMTSRKWADGARFTQVWEDRAGLSYS